METVSSVAVKLELESGSKASQNGSGSKVMLREEINIKSEPMEENDGENLEPANEEVRCAPEAIMVKLEPNYYTSGEGRQAPNVPSSSQNTPLTQSSTNNPAQQPKTFEDLVKIWENNEEQEEFGYFFAYCRATADCGGYDVDTDTDMDEDEDVENIPIQNHNSPKYYIGRNGYKWSKSPEPLPGNTYVEDPECSIPNEKNPYNIWTRLIDESILQEILKWTNVKLEECRALIRPSNHDLRKLDMIELKAFFGSFMFTVFFNMNIHPVRAMYIDGIFHMPIFESIMSQKRFLSILNCLSFGDPQLDIEAPEKSVAVLFEKFVENCGKIYKGSSFAVIGETVVPFWGDGNDDRFPSQYTEKPCRDGFRLPCMFDVKNGFLYNMYIPYADLDKRGFSEEEKKFHDGTQLALLLTKPIYGKNINVTCNKEYTSLELIDALANKGVTCTGILEKTHQEIPQEFLPSKKRQKGTVLYGYSEKVTLMSYMNKRRKATIIASSLPLKINEKAAKPSLLQLYNKTKYARMPSNDCDYDFNFYRRTRLVSMALFYKLLDFSIHNAQILFSLNMKTKLVKHNVIKFIAQKLSEEHLKRRAVDRMVSASIRCNVANIVDAMEKHEEYEDEEEDEEEFWSSD